MSDQIIPTSQALAAIIVANRSLGLFKDEARNAMIELMRRKDIGDDFDFEKFISDKLEEIPKSQLNPEIMTFLSSLSYLGNTK